MLPHQKAVIDDVTGGFEAHDRGKLIMACGTGKTASRYSQNGIAFSFVMSYSLHDQNISEVRKWN